ncbi:MAG TPA: hypothetical protein VHE30_21120 [Polyangiaceae bacterium]|nr:hypothetical protein [Polyangiaceae bacterium]
MRPSMLFVRRFFAPSLLLVSACSGTSPAGTGAAIETDASPPGSGGGENTGGSGGAPSTCDGPGYGTGNATTAFSHLSATVKDLDGNPVPDVPAQACGINLCLNGTTSASGTVAIDQSADLVRPAFKYGGGQHFAKFALPLTGDTAIHVDLGDVRTVAFDAPELGAPVVPGTAATSHGVSLLLPAGGSYAPDPIDYDTADLKKFRAASIPVAEAPSAVDPSLGFSIVVALTPSGAVLCPNAKLSVPNSAGLPAGTAVEFFVHGTEVQEDFAPYGGFAKVSGGAVTADGSAVETADGEGLPILSVVGIRAAR